MDLITEKLQHAFEMLISTGFELPIRFALISTNGVILAGSFELSPSGDAVDTRFVTEHHPHNDGMALPIHILFADRRGAATRVCIETKASKAASIQ